MTVRVEPAVWLVVLLAAGAQSAPPADAPPDGDFLEFLGWLVEEDGEFVDPLDMAGPDWKVPEREPRETAADDAAQENDDALDH
ncbi:MAG: hypothetical protein CMQ43_12160 [Gammaproteobacteria bacterium]|nr:hypothetical protein [Gammaproteobacteria bacterium]MBK81651.1 hypothetical protein [Gammaproteobacteria bacterium]|tara:strand:- start:488 stop:739 length:252 start_codon:yes stop_codon:yes gene_type:complete